MKKIIPFLILFMLSVSIFPYIISSANAEQQNTRFPWTTYKHDLQRTGYSTSSAPQQPTLLWKSEMPEYYYISAPSIANGKVFIGKYALDQTTGYLLWDSGVYEPRLVNVGSSPTVDGEEVYLTTFDGYIYCLRGENGAIIWSYKVGEGEQIYSCPAVTQDKVFVTTTLPGSETGYLYALWKQGIFLWNIQIGESNSTPAISDGVIFVTSYQDVYAISEEGTIIWHSSIYPDVFAEGTATISGDNIILYSITKTIYCFDKSTGELKWQKMIPRPTHIVGSGGGVAVAYGNVYVATFDGEILALDELTGNDIWDVKVGDSIFTSPSIANGKIYTSSIEYVDGGYGKSKIIALDAFSGAILWTYDYPDPEVYVPPYMLGGWSSPVIADGCIFVGFIGQKIDRPFTKEVLCIGTSNAPTAEIAYYQFSLGSFTFSDTVSAYVEIKNTGNVEWQFFVEFSVQDPQGSWWTAPYESILLSPSEKKSVKLCWTVGSLSPFTMPPPGSYNAKIAVWKENLNGILSGLLDSRLKKNAFTVFYKSIEWGYRLCVNVYAGWDIAEGVFAFLYNVNRDLVCQQWQSKSAGPPYHFEFLVWGSPPDGTYTIEVLTFYVQPGFPHSTEVPVRVSKTFWLDGDTSIILYLPNVFGLSSNIVSLKEPQQKLHLHIYDYTGSHIGFNYETGRIDTQIEDAVYIDFLNGTIEIILPPDLQEFKVVVDGKSAEYSTETYCLEIVVLRDGGLVQGLFREEGSIEQGETQEYMIQISEQGTITVIFDDTPPTTILLIDEPKYVDMTGNIYVTSSTPFTLIAEDNPGGTGVASTLYRIYNSTYDTGWMEYSAPFYLTRLSDCEYLIDYYSIDNIGNVEPTNTATVILDNTSPATTLTIGEPKYFSEITYVTPDTAFTLVATDNGSGVCVSVYRVYNATYDSGWMTYTGPFYLTSLADGTYTIEYYSIDNVQNAEATQAINVTLFSWNYIFEDTYGRETILKINLAHKFFQFITPDNDYGVRNATYMRQCGRAIIIQHWDKELRLITVVVDTKLDFCYAMAWDLQTRKCYVLIDKAGTE